MKNKISAVEKCHFTHVGLDGWRKEKPSKMCTYRDYRSLCCAFGYFVSYRSLMLARRCICVEYVLGEKK